MSKLNSRMEVANQIYEHTSRFKIYPFTNHSLPRRIKIQPFHFASFLVHLNFYKEQTQDISLKNRLTYPGVEPNNVCQTGHGTLLSLSNDVLQDSFYIYLCKSSLPAAGVLGEYMGK
jgi:hypothetical protein